MGKDMYKINEFKVFNEYIENPTFTFICGNRSCGKTYATKKMIEKKKDFSKVFVDEVSYE